MNRRTAWCVGALAALMVGAVIAVAVASGSAEELRLPPEYTIAAPGPTRSPCPHEDITLSLRKHFEVMPGLDDCPAVKAFGNSGALVAVWLDPEHSSAGEVLVKKDDTDQWAVGCWVNDDFAARSALPDFLERVRTHNCTKGYPR